MAGQPNSLNEMRTVYDLVTGAEQVGFRPESEAPGTTIQAISSGYREDPSATSSSGQQQTQNPHPHSAYPETILHHPGTANGITDICYWDALQDNQQRRAMAAAVARYYQPQAVPRLRPGLVYNPVQKLKSTAGVTTVLEEAWTAYW
ncbi:hypothetical protein QFC22_005249 [Naganishia vaughanmartiniae]|uniref:Uncharacterized protein n=1 Tax=Naganishia vaughanmartiniae TaxID=1424756 RepID=A0ACC2WVN6_9TREE|nr:hypothetical protein QFC22_005249 [Naganishia vaughanmartiniae]